MLEGRTAFVIARRPNTVRDADRIAVLRDGPIAEIGSHAELMAGGGYYAGLVENQRQDFLTEAGGPSFRAA